MLIGHEASDLSPTIALGRYLTQRIATGDTNDVGFAQPCAGIQKSAQANLIDRKKLRTTRKLTFDAQKRTAVGPIPECDLLDLTFASDVEVDGLSIAERSQDNAGPVHRIRQLRDPEWFCACPFEQ